MAEKSLTSFRLTEEAQLLLVKLAETDGIDRTAVLETLIRERAREPAPVPAPTTIIGTQFGPGMYNFARNTVLGPQGGTIGGQPVQAWAGMKVQGIDPETKLPLKLTAIVYPSPTPGISQYDGWLQVPDYTPYVLAGVAALALVDPISLPLAIVVLMALHSSCGRKVPY